MYFAEHLVIYPIYLRSLLSDLHTNVNKWCDSHEPYRPRVYSLPGPPAPGRNGLALWVRPLVRSQAPDEENLNALNVDQKCPNHSQSIWKWNTTKQQIFCQPPMRLCKFLYIMALRVWRHDRHVQVMNMRVHNTYILRHKHTHCIDITWYHHLDWGKPKFDGLNVSLEPIPDFLQLQNLQTLTPIWKGKGPSTLTTTSPPACQSLELWILGESKGYVQFGHRYLVCRSAEKYYCDMLIERCISFS